MSSEPKTLHNDEWTRAVVLRALVKALALFALFNIGYAALQPALTGLLPTLYNRLVFAGRLRFIKGYEYDPYRLLDDHIMSQARDDTFNIVFLGSSEIWGSRTIPSQSVPTLMDASHLTTSDGRPVRVYNLGYPFPYAFKDLVILEAALRKKIPIDLVILSTFDATLSSKFAPHAVASANPTLQHEVIEHYSLDVTYASEPETQPGSVPFWDERNRLLAWSSMQAHAPVWTLLGDDIEVQRGIFQPAETPTLLERLTLDRMNPQPDMIAAFAQLSQETGIPVIILAAPMPFKTNEFIGWLRDQTQKARLPLLDCWNVFRRADQFEDVFHIRADEHQPYTDSLIQALSQTPLSALGPALPLQPSDSFMPPEERCSFYPAGPVR